MTRRRRRGREMGLGGVVERAERVLMRKRGMRRRRTVMRIMIVRLVRGAARPRTSRGAQRASIGGRRGRWMTICGRGVLERAPAPV
jgi:hypothetical protein